MPMRSIHGAALVFAATLAATVGSPGPAEAFLPLPIPIPMLQQSQPPVESRSGRSPSDNNFRRGSDKGKYESAQPIKPSTGTRAKRDEESPSDNNFRRGSDRGKYESAQPVKPSTGTREKRDEES